MVDVVFMFELHQPYRLRRDLLRHLLFNGVRKKLSLGNLFDLIFDDETNRSIFTRIAERCYVKATKILLESIRNVRKMGKEFKFSMSLSGVLIEQAMKWDKRVIDIISEAIAEDAIELVEQTYYHSLASLFSVDEFVEQIELHRALVKEIFGVAPRVAENTEFIYNNEIAYMLCRLGYKAILTEGVERVLGWRSPNYVYGIRGCDVRVLMRNYRLSDDIGFRFSDRNWDQYPLTADKYAYWLSKTVGDVVLVAIDYETFGEHHHPSTGILEFLKWLPIEIAKYDNIYVASPYEAAYRNSPRDYIDVSVWETISWADERDLSAWLGNNFQKTLFEYYTSLEPYVKAMGGEVLRIWRALGSSDHLYYMATKTGPAGDVHNYFSPYKDVITAYTTYLEALTLFTGMVLEEISSKPLVYAKKIVLPNKKAFHFYQEPEKPLPYKARTIAELKAFIQIVPPESIAYHVMRKDLARWIRENFFLDEIANELENLAKALQQGALEPNKLREAVLNILSKI
ncbi:MAG: alpha-amylase [Ignisphaera sp.]